jgi:hypothetical protein
LKFQLTDHLWSTYNTITSAELEAKLIYRKLPIETACTSCKMLRCSLKSLPLVAATGPRNSKPTKVCPASAPLTLIAASLPRSKSPASVYDPHLAQSSLSFATLYRPALRRRLHDISSPLNVVRRHQRRLLTFPDLTSDQVRHNPPMSFSSWHLLSTCSRRLVPRSRLERLQLLAHRTSLAGLPTQLEMIIASSTDLAITAGIDLIHAL